MTPTGTFALTSGLIEDTADTTNLSSKNARSSPEAIKKAATQFEALLISEVLKTSREADGSGWMGTDDADAGSTLSDMSEQQISQTLAASGGFGLAKIIGGGLTKLVKDSGGSSTSNSK
jgi:flagellar protein FlgJ